MIPFAFVFHLTASTNQHKAIQFLLRFSSPRLLDEEKDKKRKSESHFKFGDTYAYFYFTVHGYEIPWFIVSEEQTKKTKT